VIHEKDSPRRPLGGVFFEMTCEMGRTTTWLEYAHLLSVRTAEASAFTFRRTVGESPRRRRLWCDETGHLLLSKVTQTIKQTRVGLTALPAVSPDGPIPYALHEAESGTLALRLASSPARGSDWQCFRYPPAVMLNEQLHAEPLFLFTRSARLMLTY